MKRNALMKVFAVILALGMLVSYIPVDATAKTAVPQQTVTVDNAVLDDINKNGVATYWVDFTNTADLSRAYFMDWSERGWYVYETLKEQAEKTQSAAVAYLEATGVEYQSFWIANRILVKQSNNSVLSGLQQLPNVVSISAQKSYTLYEPEKVSVSDETKESNQTLLMFWHQKRRISALMVPAWSLPTSTPACVIRTRHLLVNTAGTMAMVPLTTITTG